MRRTLMTAFGSLLLLVLAGGMAQAQYRPYQGRDGDHDRDDGYYQNSERRERREWFQRGIRDGQEDRERGRKYKIRNRRWDDGGDRDAYMAGYRRGYNNSGYGWNGRDRDDDRPWGGPNGPYRGGQGPYNQGPYNQGQSSSAYNFGYQDGLTRGQNDRRTGHSFRPTEHDAFKDADHGYSINGGDKQAYKDAYRNGFNAGYSRGYGR